MTQTHDKHDHQLPPGVPRWVKAIAAIALILVLLVGVVSLFGGEHGPGQHMPSVDVTEIHHSPVDHQGQHP